MTKIRIKVKPKVLILSGEDGCLFGVPLVVEVTVWVHEVANGVVGDESAVLLVLLQDIPEDFDGFFLDFGGHHAARGVFTGDVAELFVAVEKVEEVVVGDVDGEVGPFFDVLLFGEAAAREGFFADLFGKGCFGVVHENDFFAAGGAGFVVGMLKAGQEARLDGSGLDVAELLRDFTGHTEVRVLVDGHRNEAVDVFSVEDVVE